MTGGGIINRKSISILLLLLTIVLSTNVGAISAAMTSQTSVYQGVNNDNSTIYSEKNTFQTSKNNSTTSSSLSSNSTTGQYAAAGTVTTVSSTPVSFSVASISNAASRVKSFIETNHKLPSYVVVSNRQVTMPQFLQLLDTVMLKVRNGSTTNTTLTNVGYPNPGIETVKAGNISTIQYLTVAKNVKSFIDTYHRVPSYARSVQGRFVYGTLIYTFSKVMSFYGTNKRLPNFVSINPGITVPKIVDPVVPPVIPDELKTYLDPTNNCQADSSVIKSLAASITSGLTSPMDRATAIFNWVRDHISYSFYYNTQKGALGTYYARTANCVDTSHLMIALMRAAGNPAKYQHVYAQFSSGTWYGHVYALIYVNGTWYKADGTSSRNLFGVVNNWNTNTAEVQGTYKELPF